MFLLELFVFAILGVIIGSFANVVILRAPKSLSIGGRSRCPSCVHILSPLDLIPVLSFILLRGRCRYCQASISYQYAIVELVTGLAYAWIFWTLLPSDLLGFLFLCKYLVVVTVAIIVFVVDFKHFLILDAVLLPAVLIVLGQNVLLDITGQRLGLLSGYTLSGFLGAISATIAFYGIWFLSGGKWMGFGDVKFVGFMGMVLGFPLIWLAVLLAFMMGGLVAVPLLLFANKNLQSRVPFGTFLSVALVVVTLYGQAILSWYLGLLGL